MTRFRMKLQKLKVELTRKLRFSLRRKKTENLPVVISDFFKNKFRSFYDNLINDWNQILLIAINEIYWIRNIARFLYYIL
jgi:succinate dehydrogenase flavin-adding protein (antitoxin of CptAB toxin-antitoxin module)